MALRHLQQARPVLLALSLLPHGTTTSLDPTSSARNAETPARPPGELHPPHDVYAERILAAYTSEAADALVAEARALLVHYHRRALSPVAEEGLAELKARIVADGNGWTAEEVGRHMRCLPRMVRVARIEANRHPDTGYAMPPASVADPHAWAIELRDAGLSLRQVHQITGLSVSYLARHVDVAHLTHTA